MGHLFSLQYNITSSVIASEEPKFFENKSICFLIYHCVCPPPNSNGVNIIYLSASLVAKPPTATRTRSMKTEDPTNCPKFRSSALETVAPYILNSNSGRDVQAPTNIAPATSCLIFS